MIGNLVRIITSDGYPSSGSVEGTLHKLDVTGAIIWRRGTMPEQQGNIFVPMHRIREIVDLGRAAVSKAREYSYDSATIAEETGK
jgi:hypothetical protein